MSNTTTQIIDQIMLFALAIHSTLNAVIVYTFLLALTNVRVVHVHGCMISLSFVILYLLLTLSSVFRDLSLCCIDLP